MSPTVTLDHPALQTPVSSFAQHCRCGRIWNLVMERGKPHQSGFLRCSCEAELISWSGAVVFNVQPVDVD